MAVNADNFSIDFTPLQIIKNLIASLDLQVMYLFVNFLSLMIIIFNLNYLKKYSYFILDFTSHLYLKYANQQILNAQLQWPL